MAQIILDLTDSEVEWIHNLANLSGKSVSDYIIQLINDSFEDGFKPPKCDFSLFDEFWDAYPKKVGKVAAQRIWQRLNIGPVIFEKIMNGLSLIKIEWDKGDPQYIPHPSTWLNQQRWEDVVENQQSWAERRDNEAK